MADSRFLRGPLLGFGALLLVYVGAFFIWNAWTFHELDKAKARFASAGRPMRIADTVPPAVPEPENAAPLVKKIGEITARADDNGSGFADIAEKLKRFVHQRSDSAESDFITPQEGRELLARAPAREILALAREAADRPGFDAKLDYSLGAKLTVPHIGHLRNAADTLRVQIRLSIGTSAEDEAARDIWRILNLADFLAREPTLISHLLRIVLLNGAVEELGYAVAANALSEAWALRFSDRLAKIDLKAEALLALDRERVVFGEVIFAEMISGNLDFNGELIDPNGTGKKNLWSYIPAGWWRLELASYLTYFDNYRSLVVNHWSQPLEQSRQAEALFTTIPYYRTLVRIALPSIAAVVSKMGDSQIRIDAAEAGLAAYRYRLRQGSFPDSLAELVPDFLSAVPTDNYNGAPMIYRREHTSFLVYSVGRNGRDDGGQSTTPDNEGEVGFYPSRSHPEPAAR